MIGIRFRSACDRRTWLNDSPLTRITFDNGKEFAAHQDIAYALRAKIFFATPYHRRARRRHARAAAGHAFLCA